MTLDQFIDALFVREGKVYADQTTKPPIDQPTAPGGITAAALAEDRGVPVASITVDMLKALTLPECREIVTRRLQREIIRHGLMQIAFEPLRYQVLDFGHNSGIVTAIQWLQRTVSLPELFVDGIIGPRTVTALGRYPGVLVNNALAASRARLVWMDGAVRDPALRAGVAARAIGFVISTRGDHEGEA